MQAKKKRVHMFAGHVVRSLLILAELVKPSLVAIDPR